MYAEMAYFDGNHCQHVADWQEARRLARKRDEARDVARSTFKWLK